MVDGRGSISRFGVGLPAAALAAVPVIFAAVGTAAAASAIGHASVTIVKSIVVAESAPLSFGMIGATPSGGQVVLSPSGTVSGPNGYTLGGAATVGKITVLGEPGAAVTISFGTAAALTGPGVPMSIGGFTHNAGASPALDGAGQLVFSVGATLGVNAVQSPGSYSGSYVVTVNY